MDIKIQEFIKAAKEEMEKENINVFMQNTEYLELSNGDKCSGYFEDGEDDVTFAVATGKPEESWFEIFVHEFCHFKQWRDNKELWSSIKMDDGKEALDWVLESFSGERELTELEIETLCLVQAQIEFDCERKVLEIIENFNLPIDPQLYAKKANSYIVFYYAMPNLKSWCNGRRTYEVPEIMELMPDHMDLSVEDYRSLAKQTQEIYREHCLYPVQDKKEYYALRYAKGDVDEGMYAHLEEEGGMYNLYSIDFPYPIAKSEKDAEELSSQLEKENNVSFDIMLVDVECKKVA